MDIYRLTDIKNKRFCTQKDKLFAKKTLNLHLDCMNI